jgi:thioredoxin-related protein
MHPGRLLIALGTAVFIGFGPGPAPAQTPSPHAIEIPAWFSQSFLDMQDDAAEATRSGKRLLLYFGQDGCPYCKELMQTNFTQREIVDKTRRHFVPIALNIWGDREVTWVDGRRMGEKELAKLLKVQFTPTLLFLQTDGSVALRLNGYQPPGRFEAVLDYVIERRERSEPLSDYLKTALKESGRPRLAEQPFLMRAPLELRRRAGSKPLAVLFETRQCRPCDEMHDQAFTRPPLRELLGRFDVARLGLGDAGTIETPDGRTVDATAWSRELKIEFTPAVVFFDDAGREVFRFDGYTRPFHFESAFEYVSSGAYRTEPQFQRFVQRRADRQRAAGQRVDLWR